MERYSNILGLITIVLGIVKLLAEIARLLSRYLLDKSVHKSLKRLDNGDNDQ